MSVPMDQMGSALQAPPEFVPEAPPAQQAGLDYEVAVGLLLRLIYKEETMAEVVKGMQAGDFIQTSATLIADMTVQVREQMIGKDLVEDESIWAAEGGVIHTIADTFVEIGQQVGMEPAFDEGASDMIYEAAIQALEKAEGGGQQPPPEQAMPTPQPAAPTSALGV